MNFILRNRKLWNNSQAENKPDMSFEVNQSFPKMSRKNRQEFGEDLIKSESSFSYGWPSSILSNSIMDNSRCNTFEASQQSFNTLGFESRHILNPNKLILCLDNENKVSNFKKSTARFYFYDIDRFHVFNIIIF